MRLQVLVILFLQGVLAEPPSKISGYLGHNITLPSGVDPSWILTRIEWSVFSNTTWIATYYNGKINTDRLSQYKGRLSLDKTSGDLTIHNLNTKDAREYTVNLINNGNQSIRKIELTVKQRLQKPTIRSIPIVSTREGCWMQVHCSTPDKGVTFHWEVNPPSVLTYSRSKQDGNVPLLVAFLSTSQNPVNFTCTCSTETQNASTVFTSKCDVDIPTSHVRERTAALFLGGLVTSALIILVYVFREKISDVLKTLRGKLCPSAK
ncbi:uncharacterized protein LOC113121417 [Mastacembelus armatus]|uniref:uncharacterized protein LOC113121417 n=1 Tax=Mastacembelus armatus TaxID=205130 RepID=UPI000E465229|nr:uncharacterized protein LOC113121417 [Mastacembelus armatus]